MIEVVQREPINEYFFSNKHYIFECNEKSVLFLDVDTFVFGDVENIFKKYADVDFAACENRWHGKLVPKFNGGIQLYNNLWHKNLLKMPVMCEFVKNEIAQHNLEEYAISLMVEQLESKYKIFERSDCHTILWQQDIQKCRESIVFHSYNQQWGQVDAFLKNKKKFIGRLVN